MLPSLPWLSNAVPAQSADTDGCACRHTFAEPPGTDHADRVELVVDADDCDGGDLATDPACRAAVVDALAARDADVVRVRDRGLERRYADDAAGFLVAAGRFVDLVGFHDSRLAVRARTDPLGAAREATGRAGPVADLAAETGLAEGAARVDGYEDALRAFVGPAVAHSRVATRPPAGAALVDSRDLPTGATVRKYRTENDLHYHLVPVEAGFDDRELTVLDDAASVLARGDVGPGERAPGRAVRRVAADGDPVAALTTVIRKHTSGNGVLDDLFADPRVSDVYVSAPTAANPIRVRADGETASTNVRLTPAGVAALASRIRRASGRAFSRATPRVDASLPIAGGDDVRVAGVTRPLSDGPAFAFRRHDDAAWTLPRLVANGTVPPGAAALLSLAVERGATGLVAGSRGAGKTATLEALVRELPRRVRTVLIEDTPELPVAALQTGGRDVQALRVGTDEASGETTPVEALRTALRLGDGALVVGEVRGPEARVLYEAMRVGAAAGAVLGTVHGANGEAVRERMVTDLGVPESSFAATDLVATMVADGPAGHRLACLEEVRRTASGTAIVSLYRLGDDGLVPTGVVDRGDSVLVASLAAADESYADVRAVLRERAGRFADHVAGGDEPSGSESDDAVPAEFAAVGDEP